MLWFVVATLCAIAARFSSDWTRYLDATAAIIATYAWLYGMEEES